MEHSGSNYSTGIARSLATSTLTSSGITSSHRRWGYMAISTQRSKRMGHFITLAMDKRKSHTREIEADKLAYIHASANL